MIHPVAAGGRARKFVSDSLGTVVTDGLAGVLAVLNGMILARALGPESRGIFAIAVLVPVVLHRFGMLGFGAGTVHGVATDPDSGGRRAVNVLLFTVVVAGSMSLVGSVVYSTDLVPQLEQLSTRTVALALVGLAGLVFSTCARSLVVGRDQLSRRNWLRITTPATRCLAYFILLVLLGLDVSAAVLGWCLAILAESSLGLCQVLPLARRGRWRPDFGLLRRDLGYGLRVYLSGIAMILLFQMDQFLVAYFLDSAAVGHYALAVSLMSEMGVLPLAVQAAFLPKITRRYTEIGSREKMTPAVCRVMLLTMTGIALLGAVLASTVIPLLYGEDFRPSVMAFVLLLPSTPLLALLIVLNAALRARGRPILTSVGAGAALLLNVLLDLVMIPAWGIAGAAIASTLAYFVGSTVVMILFLRLEPSVTVGELILPRGDDLRRVGRMLWELAGKVGGRRG